MGVTEGDLQAIRYKLSCNPSFPCLPCLCDILAWQSMELLLFLTFSGLVADPKDYVTRWPIPRVVC